MNFAMLAPLLGLKPENLPDADQIKQVFTLLADIPKILQRIESKLDTVLSDNSDITGDK